MKNPVNSEHGAFISRRNEARAKVARFREKFPDKKVEGLLLSAKLLRQMLDHGDCANLKFYYGLDDDDELTLIVAPADAHGQRIGVVVAADGSLRHPEGALKDGDDDKMLNHGGRIPPPPSDL